MGESTAHQRRSDVGETAVSFPVDTRNLFSNAPIQTTKNPMTRLYGITDGEECKGCIHFDRYILNRPRFHKCEVRGITAGAGTDHRVHWPACGLFEVKA